MAKAKQGFVKRTFNKVKKSKFVKAVKKFFK